MKAGSTTQLIVESFRLRRKYLQQGQSVHDILNEMPFTQDIIFVRIIVRNNHYNHFFSQIKLEFELVTKVSFTTATQRIRDFFNSIISSEMCGKVPHENVGYFIREERNMM